MSNSNKETKKTKRSSEDSDSEEEEEKLLKNKKLQKQKHFSEYSFLNEDFNQQENSDNKLTSKLEVENFIELS